MTRSEAGGRLWPGRILCRHLERAGVTHVFGLPGTGNLAQFEELRRSRIRVVAPAHELSAAYMANGYYRASGRPGVAIAVAGPGLAFSVAGLAEARLDSAAIVCITGTHEGDEGVGRSFQEIPQRALLRPIVKRCLRVRAAEEMGRAVDLAFESALEGEPGPVLLEVDDPVWTANAVEDTPVRASGRETDAGTATARLLERLRRSRRPIFIVGQGAQAAADALREVAERLRVPVLASTSGRGALPEDHPLSFALDRLPGGPRDASRIVEASDLVVVLGCRLSHNATWGFALELPPDRLFRVDASAEVLAGGPYPASDSVLADVPALLEVLPGQLREDPGSDFEAEWTAAELQGWRWGREDADAGQPDPVFPGGVLPADFFGALRAALPREAIVVSDSGHHEMMLRRHYPVLSARGLVVPSDFQSMGFGTPAAAGAALACPDRPVVAVVGDGGLRATGMELGTAVQAGADIVVLAFVDGHFGLIRRQQLEQFGRTEGTGLPPFDLEAFAATVGARHHRLEHDVGEAVTAALACGGVTVVEVCLRDGAGSRLRAMRRRVREDVREAVGPEAVARLKRWREALRSRTDEPS